MQISGMVSSLNYGNNTLYVSKNYNTQPVHKVKNVQRRDYSINRAVNRQLSTSLSSNMADFSMALSNKSVVLPNGAIFVGTIIDMVA